MAFALLNEEIVTYQTLGVPAAADTHTRPWFKMPRAGTIVAAYAAVESAVATANTTTFLAVALKNVGTVGTASANTIATFGSVATPYTWTALQGYQATFDTSSEKDVASGEWIVVQHDMTSTMATGVIAVVAHVVLGTGRVA